MSLMKVFVGMFITFTFNTQAFAVCKDTCAPSASTPAGWESYCTSIPTQSSCDFATSFKGCVWKTGVQEVKKCAGGWNDLSKNVCKQQNNLPEEIVELACDNLQVVSSCAYETTCE